VESVFYSLLLIFSPIEEHRLDDQLFAMLKSSTIHLSSGLPREESVASLMGRLWAWQSDTDIIFCCPDGKIGAHKPFIKRLCPILGSLIPPYETLPGGGPVTSVLVPNFSVKIVQNFLQMIYTGKTGIDGPHKKL
jgi:hypothetical protein